jgi:hypothetical protein
LEDDAALVGPKPLKLQDQVLKGQGLRRTRLGRFGGVFSTFIHPVFFKVPFIARLDWAIQ